MPNLKRATALLSSPFKPVKPSLYWWDKLFLPNLDISDPFEVGCLQAVPEAESLNLGFREGSEKSCKHLQ